VRSRDPEFWPRWASELKRIDSDLLLIAEAPAFDPYYTTHGFDAAYDWTGELGHWAWQSAFDNPAQTASDLKAAIAADPGNAVLRFLDNNDSGPRFVTRYGVARARIAAAMLMTLPGIPSLYAGDEVGAAYEPYQATGAIAWDDPDKLQAWYHDLIALRHREPALRSPLIDLIDTGADNVLAYLRSSADGRDRLLVLLNYAASPARIVPGSAVLPPDAVLVDLLSGATSNAEDIRSGILLDGYGVKIMKIERQSS
jgi:glycosidase